MPNVLCANWRAHTHLREGPVQVTGLPFRSSTTGRPKYPLKGWLAISRRGMDQRGHAQRRDVYSSNTEKYDAASGEIHRRCPRYRTRQKVRRFRLAAARTHVDVRHEATYAQKEAHVSRSRRMIECFSFPLEQGRVASMRRKGRQLPSSTVTHQGPRHVPNIPGPPEVIRGPGGRLQRRELLSTRRTRELQGRRPTKENS